MTLAEQLASYALSVRYSDLDRPTVKSIETRLVDAVGCGLGSFNEPAVRIARRAAAGADGGHGSTVLGTRSKSSPELATFVNGLMVRYFDFNDTYLSKEPAHPSDNLAPCLAVGEAEGCTGKDVLAAAVVAYEIQCRLCDSADIRHRGWDHVNYGLVSTSLAASRLMGLTRRQATEAVNMALSGHIAMRQVRAGELSMWKGASFANAARNAVFAARLAREGMSGPSPIFEGEMGFFRQVSGHMELDVSGFGSRRGGFKVNETYIKYWPAEYHAQTAVWAALEARKHLDPDEIVSVLVETHEAGYTILGKDPEKWRPATKESADHSLPFIVAAALLRGSVDNGTYSKRNFADEEVRALMDKTTVKEDPGLTALYPRRGMPTRLTVVLKDGRIVSDEVIVPRGHPLDPMTEGEVERKFLGLTGRLIPARRRKSSMSRLWRFHEEKDLAGLMESLAVG